LVDAAATCTVRTAHTQDLLEVLGVYAQREPDGRLPKEASDLEERTWVAMMQTDGLTVYLAEIDGQAVGTATLMTMPNLTYNCAPTAFIEALVVAIGHRRKGVATGIVRRILADTRSAGCNKVQLLSHKRHATDGAHRFYGALGFEPEAEGFRLYHREVPEAVRAAKAT
jgi:GNAT superfamily N-acetyltransferase